ncbi:MAG: hypothetical protein K0S26_1091 [Bacteroidota bacterium]|jgi:hypothetical protein|nr:hypothetical protein [Bacteroidota bacterium]
MTEREIATEYLKGIQRHYLMKRYGLDFEKKIQKFNQDDFFDVIEKGINAKKDLTEDQKLELEAQLKNLILDTSFLNTEYESPVDWQIISGLFENVKDILPTDKKLPYIGTISSGEINAEAYAIKETDIKLLLIESELFTCANLLSKVFALSIPLTNNDSFSFSTAKDQLEKHLHNKFITERFNDFFHHSILRCPTDSKQYFLNSELLEQLSQLLLDSLEYFVIGHEYGHIYLDHLDSSSLQKASLSATNEDLLKIHTSWEQEFQADNVGAQVIIAMDKEGEKFPFSVLGPDLLFTFFHYRTIYSSDDNDIRQESDSHPAPLDRKRLVREYILSRYGKKDQELLNITYKMIDNIFDHHISNFKNYR